MAYDAAAIVAALEKPTLTVPRRSRLGRLLFGPTKTYRGRLLSHTEWVPLAPGFAALHEGTATDDQAIETWTRYLKAIGIPPRAIFDLPPAAMQSAMRDFLICQGRANLPSLAEILTTNTPDSPQPAIAPRAERTSIPETPSGTFTKGPNSHNSSGPTGLGPITATAEVGYGT